MKTSSITGFAIAAIFSSPNIKMVGSHRELHRKIYECLDIVKKHSLDTWIEIDNALKDGRSVETSHLVDEKISYLVNEQGRTYWETEFTGRTIEKQGLDEWVRNPIDYRLFIRKIENLASQFPELNQIIQDLAYLVDNSEVSLALSNNLWLLGRHYYDFKSSYGETGLTTSEELCVKSLKLIDVQKIMRRKDLIDDYDGIAMTLFHLAEIYFLQRKTKQAKDFYIECLLYDKKSLTAPYINQAYERLGSLGVYDLRQNLFRKKLARAAKFLVFSIVFFPVLVKAIEILPLFQILVVAIIFLAVFNAQIMEWAKGKCIRRVYKLVKKWNL